MKTLKYEKWFYIGAIVTIIHLVMGKELWAIHGMLVLIMVVLLGILRFLMGKHM